MHRTLNIFSVVLFFYLLIRAIHQPLVFDECTTLFNYVLSGKFWPWDSYLDANNHVINSLLSNAFVGLFGASSLSLRLASLLSFPLMAYFVIKICSCFERWPERILLFSGLLLCHNFIDFYSLSRGYGMSMTFLLAVVYYQMRFVQSKKLIHWFGISIFSFLAVWSNLTLFYVTCILLPINLFLLIFLRFRLNVAVISGFIIQLFGLLSAFVYLQKLKATQALYYGSDSGFWNVTVKSLSRMLFETEHIAFHVILIIITILFTAIALKKRKVMLTCLALTFWGSIVMIFIAHYLLDINFPEDRVGLYLYPLFILSLSFALKEFSLKVGTIASAVCSISLMVHFVFQLNFSHNELWKSEQIPSSFFKVIKQHQIDEAPTINAYFLQQKTFNSQNFLDFNG
ncbi:MAG: hypothetical protein MRY83_18850, partial [Flavobacteriales bacterium]|nr:hypothetical protein [Flavobacteriales bacterium]